MNRETAIKQLSSPHIEERLSAARFFARFADENDQTLLTAVLKKETAKWVKRPLELALEKCSGKAQRKGQDIPDEIDIQSELSIQVNAIKSKAIEEFSSLVIHEFSPRIAAVKLEASGEIADYENSRTGKSIARLVSVLTAIEQLRSVVKQPNYSSFDLSDLVKDTLESLKGISRGITILLNIDRPFNIIADKPALDIVFSVGLKNAIESVSVHSRVTPPEIVITASSAGLENYLSIIDSGLGFTADPPSFAAHMGYTTKKGDHIGYGLYIASSAMRAMEGELLLSNSADGGGKFEMRWFAEEINESSIN